MSDESLLAHLPFALSFLRSTGCERAAEILLLEIGSKYPELPSVLGTEFWNEEARSAQQAAEAHKRYACAAAGHEAARRYGSAWASSTSQSV